MNSSVTLKSDRVCPNRFTGDYDLAIFVSSYESRCTQSSSYDDLRFKHAIPVLFSEMQTKRARIKHDKIIMKKAALASASPPIDLHPSVTDYMGTTKEILSAIASILDPQKANRIFIDITTCPKYYFAAIMSQLILSGFAASYTLFYAEGRYSAANRVGGVVT
ncbi:MAG: hypothetical protein ACYDBB_08535, partial [Armatimonadota bacterium]